MGEVIGFVAGCIGMLQAVPQVRRLRTLGHGRGVSLMAWVLTFTVNVSWLGYGIRTASPAVIFTNVTGGALAAAVVLSLVERFSRWVFALPLLAFTIIAGVQRMPAGMVSTCLVALTVSRAPQVLQSYRNYVNAHATAVSLRSLYIMSASLLLWDVFAVVEHRGVMLITTNVALALTLVIATLEIAAGRRHIQAQE